MTCTNNDDDNHDPNAADGPKGTNMAAMNRYISSFSRINIMLDL
jgi:hypothetical protein